MNKEGFTLIEVVLSLLLLGVFSSMIYPTINSINKINGMGARVDIENHIYEDIKIELESAMYSDGDKDLRDFIYGKKDKTEIRKNINEEDYNIIIEKGRVNGEVLNILITIVGDDDGDRENTMEMSIYRRKRI